MKMDIKNTIKIILWTKILTTSLCYGVNSPTNNVHFTDITSMPHLAPFIGEFTILCTSNCTINNISTPCPNGNCASGNTYYSDSGCTATIQEWDWGFNGGVSYTFISGHQYAQSLAAVEAPYNRGGLASATNCINMTLYANGTILATQNFGITCTSLGVCTYTETNPTINLG